MAELNLTQFVERPPTRLYEVRTAHGEAYRAEGDVIESGEGWFTLWADEMTVALRVPEADIRAVRMLSEHETEAEDMPDCRPGCCVDNDSLAPTTCAFCGSRERCVNHPGEKALAQGEPGHPFSPSGPQSDEALTRVRNLSTEPEVMNADQPSPEVWRHGYRCGVLAAKSATRPRDEETRKP